MNIKVRYYELEKIGSEIRELAINLDDSIKELTSISELLGYSFIGEDADRFFQSFNEQYLPKLQSIEDMMNENGMYLLGVADVYKTLDSNMAYLARKSDYNGTN